MLRTDCAIPDSAVTRGHCRACALPLVETFADLGTAPLSNAFLAVEQMQRGETHYPLHALVCSNCLLVQLEEFESPDAIFSDEYVYFSSYSQTWLDHCRSYVERVIPELGLNGDSLVVEVASNDGYLLQYAVQRGIPVLGVEPAGGVARAARERGVRTETCFFGAQTARDLRERYGRADLLIANNVLAHVPDLHDFLEGFAILLAPGGRASLEFPHLMRLIENAQFDTIYHEHFSYFSLRSLEPVLQAHGLHLIDAEEIETHGGSLRIWLTHEGRTQRRPDVDRLLALEDAAGLNELACYRDFAREIARVKEEFLGFLLRARREGKRVAGYGAPAKGNTLLNYCGVRTDLLEFTVDRNPHKQGRFLPGSRIPVHAPARIFEVRPDYVVILPWNLRDEIAAQMSGVREWGGRLVTAVPALRIE